MKKLLLALFFVAHAALAVTSPENTSIGPPATITDDKSAIFGIGPDGFVYRNGVKTTGHATAMAWSGGKVWAKSPTAPFNWYTWTNASPPWKNTGSATSPVPSESPDGTFVTGGPILEIVDAAGAKWSLDGTAGNPLRNILKNGQPWGGGIAIALLYLDHKVYHTNAGGLWYVADADAWRQVDDPQPAHNFGLGMTVAPIDVIPPTPDLSPSKAGKSI